MLKMRSHRFFMWLFGHMQPNMGDHRKLDQDSWHRSLEDNKLEKGLEGIQRVFVSNEIKR